MRRARLPALALALLDADPRRSRSNRRGRDSRRGAARELGALRAALPRLPPQIRLKGRLVVHGDPNRVAADGDSREAPSYMDRLGHLGRLRLDPRHGPVAARDPEGSCADGDVKGVRPRRIVWTREGRVAPLDVAIFVLDPQTLF